MLNGMYVYAMKDTAVCPLCETRHAVLVFQAADAESGMQKFDLLACTNCGLVRTDPVLAKNELAHYYQQDYYGDGNNKFLPMVEWPVQLANKLRARNLLARLRASKNSQCLHPRVLDIGCGRGGLLQELAILGCACHGLERLGFAKTAESKAYELHLGELQAQGFADSSFDMLVIWHVLEHLPDPADTISQAAKLLRPGGLLVLAVPNFTSRQARWFKHNWFHLDIPRHLWHFKPDNLSGLCESTGLKLQTSSGYSLQQNLFGLIQSILNTVFPTPPNKFYRALQGRDGFHPARLLLWGVAGLLLLPIALLECVVSTSSRHGATLIQYWEKP